MNWGYLSYLYFEREASLLYESLDIFPAILKNIKKTICCFVFWLFLKIRFMRTSAERKIVELRIWGWTFNTKILNDFVRITTCSCFLVCETLRSKHFLKELLHIYFLPKLQNTTTCQNNIGEFSQTWCCMYIHTVLCYNIKKCIDFLSEMWSRTVAQC